MGARLRLHWKDRLGYCAPLKPVTAVQLVPQLSEPSKKPPCRAVFSFLGNYYCRRKPSRVISYQEDHVNQHQPAAPLGDGNLPQVV